MEYTYNKYNMAGYIMLYEKKAERINKLKKDARKKENQPQKENQVDPSRHVYVGSYREWSKANGYSVRKAGKYYEEMKKKGLLIKINKKNYFVIN